MDGVLLLACLAACALDWVAVATRRKPLEYAAKPAALALLLLYAGSQPDPSPLLIAALTFSLLGDVYLMLPGDFFAVGLGAFLLGHLAYIAAFDAGSVARAGWLVVVLLALSPIALRILRSVRDAPLRAAVGVYMVVIALMCASAVASGLAIAIAGALLFVTSDALIAWNRFVQPFAWAPTVIIVTYHIGQIGLVIGLTR